MICCNSQILRVILSIGATLVACWFVRAPGPAFAWPADADRPKVPPQPTGQQLTQDGRLKMDPVFLPGGDELVFTVLESPVQTSLMRLKLADGSQERLHPKANTTEFEAGFSADARYVAFVQSRGNLSLRLVLRDRQADKEAYYEPGGGFSGMRRPTISPDLKRVAFSIPGGGGQQIATLSLEGKDRQDLTQGDSLNCWPAFSPDGQSIAFGSSRGGDFDIYLMDADGSQLRRVIAIPGRDQRPAWSPDGRRLAFTSTRDQDAEIYVVDATGDNLIRATVNPEQDDFAAWHPDGRRLAVVSERAGKFDLYLVDAPEAP